MNPLSISLFGQFQASSNGQAIPGFRTRKVQALLIYCVVEPEAHRREQLMELLWPGMPERSARQNLRQIIYNLRQGLPKIAAKTNQERASINKEETLNSTPATSVQLLLTNRQTIQVNPLADIRVDVSQFLDLLQQVQVHRHVDLLTYHTCRQQLEQAAALYTADFLSDFYLDDSNTFETWAESRRQRFRRQLLDTLDTLTTIFTRQKAFPEARRHAERQLEIDDLRESGYRQLIEILALDGQREEALISYERCQRLLAEELGMAPTKRTTEIYKKIVAGDLRFDIPETQGVRGYELKEEIGQGAYGTIYRAVQPTISRDVAVKVIRRKYANDAEFIRRFEAEAQTIARLEHPYIVPLYDYWRDPEGAYLVMRLFRGGNLLSSLTQGPWELELTVKMVEQVASALTAAHRQGIVHRDIKPANILFDESMNAYLSDFGIAKDLSHDLQLTGEIRMLGTPDYISPEQLRQEPVTPQSDIYSLAAVLYETLAGERPFSAAPIALRIQKHLQEPLPLLSATRPGLPAQIDAVIQQATAKDPADRYADALALAEAFRQAVRGEVTAVTLSPTAVPAGVEVTNPYKGLRAFQESDAHDFYGRETLVQQLITRLTPSPHASSPQHRFLAVVGPSGSGKSSLVKAGLIPALRQEAIPGADKWFVAEMVPGSHPLEELELALLPIAVDPPPSLLEPLQKDERGLLRTLRRILPDEEGAELLLVIDQFEELFTLVADEDSRQHFIASLWAALQAPRSPLRLVVTLRADFYDRPLQLQPIADLFKSNTEIVLPLNQQELTWAVQEPARQVGVGLEAGVVTAVVADVADQPGALPLLQYALTELFDERQDNIMTLAAYQALGGVSGALAQRAEELYAGFNKAGQEAARQLFLRLVTLGEGVEDTRRRVLRAEVVEMTDVGARRAWPLPGGGGEEEGVEMADVGARRALPLPGGGGEEEGVEMADAGARRAWPLPGGGGEEEGVEMADVGARRALPLPGGGGEEEGVEMADAGARRAWPLPGGPVERVLDTYGRYRLLTFDHDPLTRAPTVEVAHEALLREWPRLRRWLAESRDDVRLQRLLAAAAAEWVQADQEDGFLLRGSRLDLFADWSDDLDLALTPAEQAFLAASLTAREQREAAEAARQQRELETTQQLAETEHRRAEEQSRAAKNLRRRAVYLGLALVVAAMLAVAAIFASYQSSENQEAAQIQAAILLASGAEAALADGFYDRAVLLALEALQNYPYTPQAERALGRAVSYNRAFAQYEGHEAAVTSVDWSPDGRRAASTGSDNTVQIWDPDSGETQMTIPLPEGITGNQLDMGLTVKWSPDGQKMAVLTGDRYLLGSQDYDVSLWDATTGELLTTVEISNEAEPEQRDVGVATSFTRYATGSALAFAAKNGQLASVGGDNTALIWDEGLSEPILTLAGHDDDVNSIQWSPDETKLVTASLDGTARIWDAQTGEELLRLEGHEERVTIALWSPDGKYLATAGRASEDEQICLWEAGSGQQERCISGDSGPIWSLGWSADSSRLISGNEDANIHVWEVASGQLLESMAGHKGPVLALAGLAEMNKLISSDGNSLVRSWNMAFSTAAAVFPTLGGHPAWSSDGRYLALPLGDSFTGSAPPGLAIWDAEEETVLGENMDGDLDHFWWGVRYSPDGTKLLLRGPSRLWPDVIPEALTAHVVDAATGESISTFTSDDDENWLRDASWSPDGSQVAGAKINGEIHIWDYKTGNMITTLLHGEGTFIIDVDWSPDGSKIASSATDGIVRVWNATTWEPLVSLRGHDPDVTIPEIAWAPDGSRLLTVSGNDETGATDNTARIWDTERWEELLVISGHSRQVSFADWSPDGSRIVTASSDDTTRIWNAETGEELLVLDTPNIMLSSASWSNDGKHIATSGFGQQAAVWRVWQSTEELITYAKACCVYRELTSEERLQFGLPVKE